MSETKKIHLVAICGMGMGSLAGLLRAKGFHVTGSDQNVYPPMSTQLEELGIVLKTGFHPENLVPTPDLVIVGNAVSKNNPEVEAMLAQKIPYLSMPQAVAEFFLQNRTPLVVAGTHGKSTTTGLLAWLLERTGKSPSFLVGGVLKNFGRSYQLGNGKYFVIEGDEYDTAFFDKGPKFLHYRPQALILNPIEFDHADIYRDLAHMMESYQKLATIVPAEGLVIAHGTNPNVKSLIPHFKARVMTFGLTGSVDFGADQLSLENKTRFRLLYRGKPEGEVLSPLPGRYNVENLLAVISLLFQLGVSLKEINAALAEFQGVKRRQDLLGTFAGMTLIDDFAHHPTAVQETLRGIRERYPNGKLWAIFEARSNTTRRKIFQHEFPAAFGPADQVIFGPVYLPEKIPPAERLDPEEIVHELRDNGKKARYLETIDGIVDVIAHEAISGDLICLMSNGSFGGLAQKIISRLQGGV